MHTLAILDPDLANTAGDSTIKKTTPVKVLFTDKNLKYARIISAEAGPIDATLETPSGPIEIFSRNVASMLGLTSSDPPANAPALDEAVCYDDNAEIPMKDQHASVLSSLNPDFLPYVKTFICKCWEQGIKIQLNSGGRSSSEQQQLYDQWIAGGKTGIRPAREFSYHNAGMAIDFNPILANGKKLMRADLKGVWQQSGIPGIGNSLGLRWGGHFADNYDPIHFDFQKFYTKDAAAAAAEPTTPTRASQQATKEQASQQATKETTTSEV
jgi:hypothetical protein